MKVEEIINNIEDIYAKMETPQNVRDHMRTVAEVANYISKKWKQEEKLDIDLIKVSCLVHDLGNMVRFDNESLTKLQAESPDVDWKRLRESKIKKYGSKDKQATKEMLMEIHAPQEVINMITNNALYNKRFDSTSLKPELRIFIYSDYRVGSKGIITLNERLSELNDRYLRNKKDQTQDLFLLFPNIVRNIHLLERDILINTNQPVLNLTSLVR